MGVPKFFRWISDRYPLLLSDVIDQTFNTPEIDNLYLDMNGIIHNCSHDNEKLSIAVTFAAIIDKVLQEIDRLVSVVVKPLKLLFIAVDGVAPRAKLNQQRSRRFKSAKERLKSIEKARLNDHTFNESDVFDSNCITPGTEFMTLLSGAIRKFIDHKIQDCASQWNKLTVYFSGSEVPGEGEHKIMSFIRDLKASSSYQPNVRHCMNGSDADMIMLSLATHEPHFLVLREVVHYSKGKRNKPKTESTVNYCDKLVLMESAPEVIHSKPSKPKDMQFVRIHILREYLRLELVGDLEDSSFYDTERLINDFVFLTFFVGNDFLPCLPALDIGDDAFDVIFDAYKQVLTQERNKMTKETETSSEIYLVNGDVIDLTKLEQIVSLIGATEILMYAESRMTRKQRRAVISPVLSDDDSGPSSSVEQDTTASSESSGKLNDAREQLKRQYYMKKFHTDITSSEGISVLRDITGSYFQGLHWCLSYYSRGCVSWSWFYPCHYGPFLHDLTGLASEDVRRRLQFDLSAPFTPFQQLLACLPAVSCGLLPSCYRFLMTSDQSPLIEYFPEVVHSDRNGKRQSYEAVLLLPFINRERLLSAEAEHCPESILTDSERQRNTFGVTLQYLAGDAVKQIDPWLVPGECFRSQLVEGTSKSLPGFPSLSECCSSGDGSPLFIHKPAKPAKYQLDNVYFPSEFSIRLLLNETVCIFLSDLCKQLEELNPDFQSVLNRRCDDGCAFGGGGPVNQFYATVLSNCNLQFTLPKRARNEVNGDCSEKSAKARKVLQSLLSKYVAITNSCVESTLLPTCRIDAVPISVLDNGVRKVVKMHQVALNIDKSVSYKALELLLTGGIRWDLFDHEQVNEKKQYYRSKMAITIGYYHGESSEAFLKWLNGELSDLTTALPTIESRSLELVYAGCELMADNAVCGSPCCDVWHY